MPEIMVSELMVTGGEEYCMGWVEARRGGVAVPVRSPIP